VGEPVSQYRLLDTLRQYAWERLRGAGEAELARRRHLDHFLVRAEYLFSPNESLDGPTRELDSELDNLRSAFEWCFEADPCAGLRLVGATHFVWFRRSSAEGRNWARAFLDRCPEHGIARARALNAAGNLEVISNPDEARRLLNEARAIAAQCDEETLAAVEYALGFAAFEEEDSDQAIFHMEQANAVLKRLAKRPAGLQTQVGLGWALLTDRHRREQARVLLEHARTKAQELGDRHSVGAADYGLGLYWRWTGHPRQALDHFRRALETLRGIEVIPTLAATLLHIARLVAADDPVRAARLAGAGLAIGDRAGVDLPPRLVERLRTELEKRLGTAQARRSWSDGEGLTLDEMLGLALRDSQSRSDRPGGLTQRELELTALVARGLTSPDIGALLHLSPRTVDNHLARIYARLGLSSRVQLATWYAQNKSEGSPPEGSARKPVE
jgi:non-specific serine/threonine protein kinase